MPERSGWHGYYHCYSILRSKCDRLRGSGATAANVLRRACTMWKLCNAAPLYTILPAPRSGTAWRSGAGSQDCTLSPCHSVLLLWCLCVKIIYFTPCPPAAGAISTPALRGLGRSSWACSGFHARRGLAGGAPGSLPSVVVVHPTHPLGVHPPPVPSSGKNRDVK